MSTDHISTIQNHVIQAATLIKTKLRTKAAIRQLAWMKDYIQKVEEDILLRDADPEEEI